MAANRYDRVPETVRQAVAVAESNSGGVGSSSCMARMTFSQVMVSRLPRSGFEDDACYPPGPGGNLRYQAWFRSWRLVCDTSPCASLYPMPSAGGEDLRPRSTVNGTPIRSKNA